MKPNLIVILVDDLRFDETGASGHPYLKSPHIDRLAHEGAQCVNAFHTTPLCSPNRASILTGQWLGLLVPRGTPNEIVQRLHRAAADALATPEVKDRLAQSALTAVGSSPKEFEGLIRADLERWGKLGRELGIKPQ